MITCYVHYRLDMYKVAEFERYARLWIPLVEKFGGVHHGYFLPHESPSDLAVALFSFDSLAAYEEYRRLAEEDEECLAAYRFAAETRCILSYERSFLRPVLSSTKAAAEPA
ncbi:MAG: NIPSNAP family protein [Acidobacteriota bacterium]